LGEKKSGGEHRTSNGGRKQAEKKLRLPTKNKPPERG